MDKSIVNFNDYFSLSIENRKKKSSLLFETVILSILIFLENVAVQHLAVKYRRICEKLPNSTHYFAEK